MKNLILPVLLLLLAGQHSADAGIPDLQKPAKGQQYQTIRVSFAQNLPFTNPFDLLSNQVELHIQQPDFSQRVLSFFYDGDNADGVQKWEARFAPSKAGSHRFQVKIAGKSEAQFDIEVAANTKPRQGGLVLSEQNGAFQYESGELFRGIGLNVCWAEDYEYYFKKLQAAGSNITRIWMCPWNLPFEWTESGLGKYNLASAQRLDRILELADQYGIFVMLCMDYHGVARKGAGYFKENRWLDNPYNHRNGGPCKTGAELYTDDTARRFFKQRYKYLVSRFGHSPRLATWEFYNEADLMSGKALPVNRWHVEMGEFIKSIDVHQRLVSTSGTRVYPEKLVDAFRSDAMDYVMFHDYNSLNLAPHYTDLHEMGLEYYQKPFVIGEFGVDFRGADRTYQVDSLHVGLHNALWAGWFNETPVIPLSWWWDNYIDPHDLWGEYQNLARFAESFDLKDEMIFRTLTAGNSATTGEQIPCMVRVIHSGSNHVLWIKNLDYHWSIMSDGQMPSTMGEIIQEVPGLAPGKYTVSWYDPQSGNFQEKKSAVMVDDEGILSLRVPSVTRDIACLITRQ